MIHRRMVTSRLQAASGRVPHVEGGGLWFGEIHAIARTPWAGIYNTSKEEREEEEEALLLLLSFLLLLSWTRLVQ